MRHLTLDDRLRIEKMYEAGIPKKQMAEVIGVSLSTIYREFDRGSIDGIYDASMAHFLYISTWRKARRKKK